MSKQDYIEQLFKTMMQFNKLVAHQTQESHDEKIATMLQFAALKFIITESECTVGKLAESSKLSKSSATQLVERLEKAGFVSRIHDKNDRRIIHLKITEDGKKKLAELKKKFLNKMTKVFSKIPEEDLKELIRIHTTLIETLKK